MVTTVQYRGAATTWLVFQKGNPINGNIIHTGTITATSSPSTEEGGGSGAGPCHKLLFFDQTWLNGKMTDRMTTVVYIYCCHVIVLVTSTPTSFAVVDVVIIVLR